MTTIVPASALAIGGYRRAVTPADHGTVSKRSLRVGPAEVAYVEAGDAAAPVAVFVHGLPTHSYLWRHVVADLEDEMRCLAPDLLGLGDTVVSPYQDFSAPFQAEILLEWLDKLGVDEAVLVGHEQGGAVVQQVVANHPERVSHLVLVDVATHDNWPVPMASQVMRLARTPGLDVIAYALELPRRVAHNARIGFARAVHDKSVLSAEVIDEYLRPLMTVDGRERARRFLLAGDNRYTLECVPALRRFDKPTLIVWGADDAFLSPSWGRVLADEIPGAGGRLELIPFCGHLVPEEKPLELARLVRALVHRPETARQM
jgi:pimeloyl-ACP methyl ester carboxylesterase